MSILPAKHNSGDLELNLLKITAAMAGTNSLDKRINQYLPLLSNRQKETVLSVIQTFAEEKADQWKDKAFIGEMNRRVSEFESGKSNTLSLEELESGARKANKSRLRKRK